MAGAIPEYLTGIDLEERIGASRVDELFDQDGDGVRDTTRLNATMAEAESIALSRMLRGFTAAQVKTLAQNDPAFTAQVAWVACELGSESKGEFIAEDGKGRYWVQYERAVEYFDMLSKSQLQSKGEAAAGQNKQTGGTNRPRVSSTGRAPNFVFAPDGDAPEGRGGF